jgi:translocation and assembly module TamA
MLPARLIIIATLLLSGLSMSGRTRATEPRPELHISSDQPALTRNLEVMLNIGNESCSADDGRKRLVRRTLLKQAEKAARAVGYYEPLISLRIGTNGDCWDVTVEVQAGEPVRLGEVNIHLLGDAEHDPAFVELLAKSPLKAGAILRHNDYQSLRDQLLQLANERGYFDHQLHQHRLVVDPAMLTANVVLTLDSGKRYQFGKVTLHQNVLSDRLAMRYLRFESGQPWDSDRLLASQQALLGSGYFSTARLERGEASADSGAVPATLHLTERPQHAWMAGIGVSTDTGPRLRLGYENRYVNQHGHRWRADSHISALNRAVSGSYEIPFRDPVQDRLMLSSGYQYENNESAESEQIRLGASLINGLFRGWVLTRSLDYERENFSVADQTETSELVMPGVQIQKIRSSHPVYPRRGWKVGAGIRGTHPSISTTATFIQSRLWMKGIVAAGPARLLARLEAGQTDVAEVATLPATVRFFAGGDNSIRGFDYQTLGPLDADGEVTGGRSLLVGSIETDFALSQRWHPAVFVDAGNAFNNINSANLRVSAGTGMRWRSPLGPIRIDLARPVDANRGWRLHLSMGPDL